MLVTGSGCQPDQSKRPVHRKGERVLVGSPFQTDEEPSLLQNDGFDRSAGHLQYTKHARCRMDCRNISQAEVVDILQHGTVNPQKSDPRDKPCPTYALEGYTLQDHQHVRIIFAPCEQVTKVVTCIDLDHDFSCNCR